jgi:hypothetical protein
LRQSHCVAQPGLELLVLLPQPPECWDYRHMLPCLALLCNLLDYFFFLPFRIYWDFHQIQCWIQAVVVSILVLFVVIEEKFSALYYEEPYDYGYYLFTLCQIKEFFFFAENFYFDWILSFTYSVCVCVCVFLGIKPNAVYILGKLSTTGYIPNPSSN